MLRIAALCLVAAACDAGQPRGTPESSADDTPTYRPTLDESGIHDPPEHAVILVTHGEGGYRLVEIVDLDVEELSMTEQNWGTQKSAATSFRPMTIKSETADAMRARATVVALTPFAAMDGDQTLFVVDGNRIFADAPRTEGERELVALMRSVDHVQL